MIPIFYITLPAYSTFVFVGMAAAILLCLFRLEKYGYNFRIFIVVLIFTLIGMLSGSKLLYFITVLPEITENFNAEYFLIYLTGGGYVFYGGLFGALVFSLLAAKMIAIDRKKLWSFLAPAFSLFHAFGRVGCFFGGCCYGVPWEYGIAMARDPEIKRFPVQLLECSAELCICLILLVYERTRFEKFKLMRIYLIVYSTARFFIEFLRGDSARGIWLGFSTSQYIAVLVIITCVLRIIVEKCRRNNAIENISDERGSS